MKRFILIVAAASAFLLGYAGAANAWPGVPDRDRWYGYFFNNYDSDGSYVLPNGIPGYINSVGQLSDYIWNMIHSPNERERIGGAFVVHTMLGEPWTRDLPPTDAQYADWESRLYRAEANGWIDWNYNFNYTYNSYWQGTNSGSNWWDDAFFYENGWTNSIRFRDASFNTVFVLRRVCANPIGDAYMSGLDANYNTSGWTDAPNTALPGQVVNFSHYIWNFGESGVNVTYAPLEGPSSAGTALPSNSGSYFLWPGWVVNVTNESFTIPNNAASGTRYCRLIGWDPVHSWGGRNGRGAEKCVTVEIPAKLKAAMSASPKPIQAGDTVRFTPAISATSNASPVVVNCTINRTLTAPSGAVSNLGAQPCVTSTGDPNITVGPGASVTLRPNDYTAADTLAVGSRVCDTITITNPSNPSYFNSPADQTAQDCSVVAKTPYVHFLGGDVWAGGGFAAVAPGTCATQAGITTVTRSRALADGTTPGSGTTYAAFALGRITNFGSGSVSRVTTTGQGDNWTFSNINSSNLGFFGLSQRCITDYVDTYQSSPTIAPGIIDVGCNNASCGGGGSGAWRVTGNATLRGSLGIALRKVYLVSGDVTIDANIQYPPTYSAAAHIPSLVVIATGNIYINSAVQQMDGIYIARGTVYTCYPKVEPATSSTCPERLTLNGSVSANRIDLFRTSGADGTTPPTQKAPAERFILSPEVYLNNALNQTTQTTITTSSVRELPPRF